MNREACCREQRFKKKQYDNDDKINGDRYFLRQVLAFIEQIVLPGASENQAIALLPWNLLCFHRIIFHSALKFYGRWTLSKKSVPDEGTASLPE